MEAVYLLFAFTITFGVGAVVGYACRGLVAKEIYKATAEFNKLHQEAKADLVKLIAELKAKL